MRPTTLLMIPIAITAILVLSSCSQSTNGTNTPPGTALKNYSLSFSNGTLDYAVNVTVPTPCIDPLVEERVLTSDPVQVLINITYSKPDPNKVCAQVITHKIMRGRITTDTKPGSVTITTPTNTYEASI